MPGQGRVAERAFTPEERAAMGDTLPALGDATVDIHLNGKAFWRNVPAAVWTLPARRLPGPQEMAVLQRTQHSWACVAGRRSAALH